MSGEKDLEQLKKEAAEKAKELARQRLAERKAAAVKPETQVSSPKPSAPAPEEQPSAVPQDEDMDLEKRKAAAAAKAKAAALAKMKAKQQAEETKTASQAQQLTTPAPEGKSTATASGDEGDDLAKRKAAAVAKAKAAAAAKKKAMEHAGGESDAASDDKAKAIAAAKAKAIAAAKAKAAAAAKAKAAAQAKQAGTATGDDEKAKAIAAAKAKAAAAAKAKATASGNGGSELEQAVESAPSQNQPFLDKYVKVIEEHLGNGVLEEYYINKLSKDVPTLVANKDTYFRVAEFLKYNEQLGFDYLSELHGTDFETHMEVYAHLYSYKNRQSVALKVKIDRDTPAIQSLQPLWAGANWPECEAYDLLGIQFIGHPNLHRIMLGDDWVGHPLRKDYEPYDVEV
ncbi:NADH-quinone oxidoreductase subunit C [Bacillus canaveralius]|uniref:NAD(P)H dehydrogenase subunit J n=1 Tax=Bacillus canaveralius TaxID=1403243 RepID=A0A2N5GQF2_9BACI|nr:NADH-quinone oxidoreductase subunit C [Bacillus canaveralius]PLR85107.1 NADH-quinone oxidoreductase subunit C [Bacillus canaveralius]PLS00895.1 NADH-quinone oxidoreductase subunit C [Bacillus canaveralius]